MKACHSCGAEWVEKEQPGFSATCQKCGEYLHCCLNCKFYAPGQHNDCNEPAAELVRDKENRNLCEWFQLGDRAPSPGAPDRAAAARARLEGLFGKPRTGRETGKE